MKPKVLKKRLVLNKKTITNLSKTSMGEVYGGVNMPPVVTSPIPCPSPSGDGMCTTEFETMCVVCPLESGVISQCDACRFDKY